MAGYQRRTYRLIAIRKDEPEAVIIDGAHQADVKRLLEVITILLAEEEYEALRIEVISGSEAEAGA